MATPSTWPWTTCWRTSRRRSWQAWTWGHTVRRSKPARAWWSATAADRVIDMPMAESSIMGFALGRSQTGAGPIIEFQFADFSTEAVTQLGLNAGTWFFRTGCAAPMLVRLPCGGGLTMGAFHSGEFEGLWSRFPGLKLLYPATPQETYESLLAGFYDPNPCLVFEHKLLYWSASGDIDFNGDLDAVWRPRRYVEGTDLDGRGHGCHGPSLPGRGGMRVRRWSISGIHSSCNRWTSGRSRNRWRRRAGCWSCRNRERPRGWATG